MRDILRTFSIMVWTVLLTLVVGSLVIFVSFFNRRGNLSHHLSRWWAKALLRGSGIPVSVTGSHHIDPANPCVYMSNHQSNFDIPVLLAYLPDQFRWLAKAELFKIPLFGQAVRRAGHISIDRSNRDSAIESLHNAATKINGGVSVMIFPEGTRSPDGHILPFKKGGIVMTIQAGVPIIPIVVRGTHSIMPKHGLRIKPGPASMEILPPIATDKYTLETKDELIQTLRDIICKAFYKSENEDLAATQKNEGGN